MTPERARSGGASGGAYSALYKAVRIERRSACRDRQHSEPEACDRVGGHLPAVRRFDSADHHAVNALDLRIEQDANRNTIDLTQQCHRTHWTLADLATDGRW